ncbi:MAG: hypothetical protein AAGI53_07780 [Planctomycetota bacterium]
MNADSTHDDSPARSPRVLVVISVLIGLTVTRSFALAFVPKLSMFGGAAPDAWLSPWITDAALGVMIPVVIIAVHKLRGAWVWGGLLVYNTLGAFDYANGLVTQWLHPLPASIAAPSVVVGSICFTLTLQLMGLGLLFRRDVVAHYLGVTPCK